MKKRKQCFVKNMESEELFLKRQIEKAFADAAYPGDDKLVEKQHPEYLEVAERFKGVDWKDWKDNPAGLLMKTVGDISFFSPAAFCYYLPLYMIQGLLDNTYPFSGDVIGHLAPSSTNIPGWVERAVEPMSMEQLNAVAAFLNFLKTKHGEEWRTYPLDEAIATVSNAIVKKKTA